MTKVMCEHKCSLFGILCCVVCEWALHNLCKFVVVEQCITDSFLLIIGGGL